MRGRYFCIASGLCYGLGVLLAAFGGAAAQTESIPSALPAATVPDGAYHLSPHKPTAEETGGRSLAPMPQNHAVIDMSSVDSSVGAGLSPHKPSASEMPDARTGLMPSPTPAPSHARIILPTDPADTPPRQPPAAATQHQLPQAQAQSQTPAPQRKAGQRQDHSDDWHKRFPKPFGNQNAQLSPVIGLGAACLNGSVTICGKTVSVPAGPIGAVARLAAPFPYLPQPFTAQCLAANGSPAPAYRIVDATEVTCEPQRCPPSEVTLCGAAISVPISMKVGDLVRLPVPPGALAAPGSVNAPIMRVRCAEGPDATARYRVENADGISCNLFPCQTSKVRLCNAAIEVPGGSPLGSVLTLTMPPPFAPDQFSVQCLGSMGLPAVYQIVDHQNVSCNMAEAQPMAELSPANENRGQEQR